MALNSGSAGAISARLSQHPAQLTTPRIQVLEKERQRTAALRWAESEHPVPVHGSLAYEEVIAFADMSLYSHPNHLDGAYWKANGWAAVIQGVGNAAVDAARPCHTAKEVCALRVFARCDEGAHH